MQKYFLFALVTALSIGIAGCKDEETEACSCSNYGSFISPDSTELVLVPSAFTPNGDGINDMLQVYAIGISSINMRVKEGGSTVFQTTNLAIGWDGTINGNSPVDCQNYSYELNVTFTSGRAVRLDGTVTLLFGTNTNTPMCPENIPNCTFGNQFDGTEFNTSIGGETFPC